MDIRAVLRDLIPLQKETLGDNEICIAVLDGPVDLSHPCFAGADLQRLVTLVPDPVVAGPMSVHGTHVASLIFGQSDSPVVGIAPRCRGLIVPIFRDDQQGRVSQLDIARAIEQAVDAGAHVINISGGERTPNGQADSILELALRRCEDNNVLVVAAVGNDGCACLQVPAAVSSVLAVGALNSDGEPLESSNWGEAYLSNGLLAPGQEIDGAAPGGGTTSLTGSSFATPVVSGIAALLLSKQTELKSQLDPQKIGREILKTATPCQPHGSPECRRHLAGVLNIPGAYASIKEGAKTAVTNDTAELRPSAESHPTQAAIDVSQSGETSETGVIAAHSKPLTSVESPVQLEASQTENSTLMATNDLPVTLTGIRSATGTASKGVEPSAADCGCSTGTRSYIFAIGQIGFDFGTEARRDTFRQLMPRVEIEGTPPASLPANPYDVNQLSTYLDNSPWESTKLIWTLNLDLTPIYALEAELAYAEDVYKIFRSALKNHALPTDAPDFVSRVSIPGILTERTVRLFSGQVVPVVVAQPRGLYIWNENALIESVMQGVQEFRTDLASEHVQQTTRNFLDKVYNQFRNLGQSPPDRALNFAATNAFVFTRGVADGLLSARNVPGGENLYSLDTITVSKSPYCRMDSDCWDVQVKFFDPENDRRARAVYQFTIDVSDSMPVSLEPVHQFLVASP
ncbi:MAG: PatA/PatG family cyanobactin maturation protease [Pseudonocardiaceae bacterium]